MRKLISFSLAVLLVLSGFPLPASAEPPPEPALVSDARSYVYDSGDGLTCEYHLPRIEGTGAGLEAVNAAIWNDLYDRYLAEAERAGADFSPMTMGMTYRWAVQGDILSLLVVVLGMYDNNTYYIYNVSLSSGERMSDGEFLKAMDLSREAFNERLQARLEERVRHYASSITDSGFVQQMCSDTLSAENLALAMPYMGTGGSLCAVCWVYTPAGAGRYLEKVVLNPGDRPSILSDFLDHCDREFLSWSDIDFFDADMVLKAVNGIYARSGRQFQDRDLQAYFRQFDWYQPDITPEAFTEDMLNTYQAANLQMLLDYRAEQNF